MLPHHPLCFVAITQKGSSSILASCLAIPCLVSFSREPSQVVATYEITDLVLPIVGKTSKSKFTVVWNSGLNMVLFGKQSL